MSIERESLKGILKRHTTLVDTDEATSNGVILEFRHKITNEVLATVDSADLFDKNGNRFDCDI